MLPSVTDHEQTVRSRSRHARPVDPEDPRARAAARLGDQPAPEAGVGDVLQVSDGSLYPALHKLEQQGWIEAEWKPTENNRRAKFYSLTRSGKRQLAKRNRIVGAPRGRDLPMVVTAARGVT